MYQTCSDLFEYLSYIFDLKSIAKQDMPIYINHSRPLISDGIHLKMWTRFERKEKPDLSWYVER